MKRSLAPRLRFGLVVLVVSFALGGSPPVVQATTLCTNATDICGTGTGLCQIGSPIEVDPGSLLDCANRDIEVTGNGNLRVTDGGYTLLAHNLTVDGPGGTLTAVEGTENIPGEVDVQLTGNLYLEGKIRTNGAHGGGRISVIAAGNVTIPDSGADGLEALGNSTTASGGQIIVEAGGSFAAYDPVLADGGGAGNNSGGSIEIRAHGDILTDTDGHISAFGHTGGGGTITIVSETGDVTLREHLKAEGQGDLGDGGSIEVVAGDYLDIEADISVMGGVNVSGGHANGGVVELQSGCSGLNIAALINSTGGQVGAGYENGSITAETSGSLTVATGITLDSHSLQSGGRGGPIRLSARDLITLNASSKLDLRGSTTSPGLGGDVALQACRLNIVGGATIDTSGYSGGSVVLHATQDPPGTGTQPLLIGNSAVVHAAGSTTAKNGRIALAPLSSKTGQCRYSNPPTPCVLDSDCTVGCQTADCDFANPDTDGVNTQFDLTPSRGSDGSVARCETVCENP